VRAIAWLVVGMVAGGAARLVVGGRDEIGVVGIVVLALAGAVVGGLLGDLATGATEVSTAGVIGSVLGAVGALVAYRAASGRRTA
jgi:uncharacterized membrane protein YeaQ/YmgE (transglycosylase-associated protein family)